MLRMSAAIFANVNLVCICSFLIDSFVKLVLTNLGGYQKSIDPLVTNLWLREQGKLLETDHRGRMPCPQLRNRGDEHPFPAMLPVWVIALSLRVAVGISNVRNRRVTPGGSILVNAGLPAFEPDLVSDLQINANSRSEINQ